MKPEEIDIFLSSKNRSMSKKQQRYHLGQRILFVFNADLYIA